MQLFQLTDPSNFSSDNRVMRSKMQRLLTCVYQGILDTRSPTKRLYFQLINQRIVNVYSQKIHFLRCSK